MADIFSQDDDKTVYYTKTNNVVNKEEDHWVRPWELEKFDDIYNRDERFFAILIKGTLSWLNRNIILYNKPINHFIFNTGSSYMYIESNGYDYAWCETTGEDTMYMHLPRCIVEIGDINVVMAELTQPFSRGVYERHSGEFIKGYNADIRRLPIELTLNLKYYLSNFNESIVLAQELIDKILFQKYFSITYLGQIIECSIEYAENITIQINQIDMEAPDPRQKTIEISVKICSNYPLINTSSETKSGNIISKFSYNLNIHHDDLNDDKSKRIDTEKYIIND